MTRGQRSGEVARTGIVMTLPKGALMRRFCAAAELHVSQIDTAYHRRPCQLMSKR